MLNNSNYCLFIKFARRVLTNISANRLKWSAQKLRALAQPLYYIHYTDIEVHKVSEEMANAMASLIGVEFATKRKSATETVLPEDGSSFKGTAISTADGAKILKNRFYYS